MHDLLTLLVVVTAFGGLSIIGVLILMSGLVAAQRTSSVITYAALAAFLFAAQLGSIAFWHSLGVGFGGEDGTSTTIIQWGSIAAVVLVGGFLALKLPEPLGRAVETAHWLRDGARISAVIIVAYVLLRFGGVFLQWAHTPATPPASPAVWLITLGGLALAWRLWHHRMWAWFAALACSVYAIARMAWYTYPMLADAPNLLVSTPVGMRLVLLVLLLCMLLFSNARKLCAVQKA